MNMNRILCGFTAAALIVGQVGPVVSYASATEVKTNETIQQETFTLEEAIKRAKENSMQIRQIQTAKENAMKAHSAAESNGANGRALYYEYNSFKSLDELGADTPLEAASYEMYQAMFGGTPSLGFEDIYDQMIVPWQVVPYQVYVQYQGLKIDEPNVVSAVEFQTQQLFYGILNFQQTLNMLQDANTVSAKKIKELELKLKYGQVAKVTVETEKLAYEKSLQEYEKNKKELRILETQFNNLVGRSETLPVVLKDPGLMRPKEQPSYEKLVTQALENRGEIKKAQFSIDSISNEVALMAQYLNHAKPDRREDGDQRLMEAKLSKVAIENQVRTEVLNAYNDYKMAEAQLQVTADKVALSEKQLVKIKQLLKAGYVKNLDVYGVELQLQNSKISYQSAVYEYNKQLDALTRITRHALN